MGGEDSFFTILFDLNHNWKLGHNHTCWQLWRRDPHTRVFQLEVTVEGPRRRLLETIESRAIPLTKEAEEKLKTLPETLAPWPIEREDEA